MSWGFHITLTENAKKHNLKKKGKIKQKLYFFGH